MRVEKKKSSILIFRIIKTNKKCDYCCYSAGRCNTTECYCNSFALRKGTEKRKNPKNPRSLPSHEVLCLKNVNKCKFCIPASVHIFVYYSSFLFTGKIYQKMKNRHKAYINYDFRGRSFIINFVCTQCK